MKKTDVTTEYISSYATAGSSYGGAVAVGYIQSNHAAGCSRGAVSSEDSIDRLPETMLLAKW